MCLPTILTMKLEKLVASGSPDYVRLSFDDGTFMRVPISVVADLGLYAGMQLSESDMDQLGEAAGRASAKLRAVHIFQIRKPFAALLHITFVEVMQRLAIV